MSTSYMNYAEKLNLPISPQSSSNPGTPSTPTTASQSFASPQSPYKAYSPYFPSPSPYTPRSPQPYGAPPPTTKISDAQRYAQYVPSAQVFETHSTSLSHSSIALCSSPVSPNTQSFGADSSTKSKSFRPDAQIYAPYVPPTPPASQPGAPHASPASAGDGGFASSVPSTPADNQASKQSASPVPATPLYERPSTASASPASAPLVSSPSSASGVSSTPANSHTFAGQVPSNSTSNPLTTTYSARNPAYGDPPISTPSPPGPHYIPPAWVNGNRPSPSRSPPGTYVSLSLAGTQSYAMQPLTAPAYDQQIRFTAPSPAHEYPHGPQSPTPSIHAALTSNPLGIQSASSVPVLNQTNVSYLASIPIHSKSRIPSAGQSSLPSMPSIIPNDQQISSHAVLIQNQETDSTSFTCSPSTQTRPPASENTQPNATSGVSVPASSCSNPPYTASIPVGKEVSLPPPLVVPPPPAYKPHDGYFTSKMGLAQVVTPPATKHDPPPEKQMFESPVQPTQGVTSPASQFPYTPKLTPTFGTALTIPVFDPQCMNQANGSVAPSPTPVCPRERQYPYTPQPTPTGVSTPQFSLPPEAETAIGGETKSSWGKRFVGDMLITRGIRAGVTSVASSVKLPAMLSPWGDNNPVTLPNVRRRDVVLLAGSHFGADAIVSGSLAFTGGLLVDAMRCVSEQVVDQAILDRIRFDESKILHTTSVKSLQITIKHQLMGVDANLRFFGERSAPLALLSCAKGWFCPYLYASGRTPSVPRSQNFAVVQCFGPFLNADSALAHKVLAEGVATMSLCEPNPACTPVNGHHRLVVFFAGISPWRTQAWSQARNPGLGKLMLHLINGCPALVIPVIGGGGAQKVLGQGAPICAWSAWTLAQMTANMDYAPERHYEELFRFLESIVSVPDVEAGTRASGAGRWRDALARGLQMLIKGAVATKKIADPKLLSMIDPERAGIVMFRY
ncbi:hypothetical protein MMC07_002734 [Pseudocyphellaria aurata]|nr:hypothetical protein [Pseudocyphellaria aurata]